MVETMHASCVLIGAAGVLIRGDSGRGKSALALTLLERAEAVGAFARLVVDDRTAVVARHGRLVATAPASLAGLIEIRGAGLQQRPFEPRAVVRLVADLVPPEEVARMPQEADLKAGIAGLVLPRQPVPVGDIGRSAVLVAAALARLSQ